MFEKVGRDESPEILHASAAQYNNKEEEKKERRRQ